MPWRRGWEGSDLEVPDGGGAATDPGRPAAPMAAPADPAWRVCLTSVDETTVSLCVPSPGRERSPWMLGEALDLVRAAGRTQATARPERFAAGRRRGAPMVAGETLTWAGVPLTVAAVDGGGGSTGELSLHLPPWDELAPLVPEAWIWELVDDVADQLRALCGVVADGRTVGFPELVHPRPALRRLWRRHPGVLLPAAWLPHLGTPIAPYTELPASGLLVVLR